MSDTGLHGSYDDANIFAKMLRGEVPCVKAFEDEVALAIMDLFPLSPGHALVIPKGVRARNLIDLPAAAAGAYFERVQKIAQAAAAAFTPDGVRVMQFSGAPAGQSVFHLHMHVIPMWDGVRLKVHGEAPKADLAELEAHAAKLRSAL